MKLSALLAPLIASKAAHETIMQVIVAYEAEQSDALERRRLADAERQSRKRDRDKSRDVTLPHSDSSLMRDRVAPVDDKLITTDTSNLEITAARDRDEFKAGLAALDPEQLNALIKARKAKKAPVTGYAAKLFVKAAANCGLTVPAAADMCIERNWLTVKPDWINPTARGSPRQPANGSHHFNNLAQDMTDEPERTFGSDQGDRDNARSVPVLTISDYRRHG